TPGDVFVFSSPSLRKAGHEIVNAILIHAESAVHRLEHIAHHIRSRTNHDRAPAEILGVHDEDQRLLDVLLAELRNERIEVALRYVTHGHQRGSGRPKNVRTIRWNILSFSCWKGGSMSYGTMHGCVFATGSLTRPSFQPSCARYAIHASWFSSGVSNGLAIIRRMPATMDSRMSRVYSSTSSF